MARITLALALIVSLLIASSSFADLHTFDRAPGYQTKSHTFTPGIDGRVRVIVVGDGSSDLDLYVYDSNGRRIGADRRVDDTGIVSFYASGSEQYSIRIENLGAAENTYMLVYETPDRASIGENYRGSVAGNTTTAVDYRPTRSGWVRTALIADQDNDLDLFVFAEDHELLDYDTRRSRDGTVEFYARAGETYSIEVRNATGRTTGFRLLTHRR